MRWKLTSAGIYSKILTDFCTSTLFQTSKTYDLNYNQYSKRTRPSYFKNMPCKHSGKQKVTYQIVTLFHALSYFFVEKKQKLFDQRNQEFFLIFFSAGLIISLRIGYHSSQFKMLRPTATKRLKSAPSILNDPKPNKRIILMLSNAWIAFPKIATSKKPF